MTIGRHVPFRGFDPHDEVAIARRRLPHWRQNGVAYFVRFRLADSLPQSLLEQWRDERVVWLRRHYIAANPAKARLKPDEYSLHLREVLMP
jgi:hypothetical protein